jgi:hypothetical protein
MPSRYRDGESSESSSHDEVHFMLQSWKPQDNKLCYCYNIARSQAAISIFIANVRTFYNVKIISRKLEMQISLHIARRTFLCVHVVVIVIYPSKNIIEIICVSYACSNVRPITNYEKKKK